MNIVSTPVNVIRKNPKSVNFTSIYYQGNDYKDCFGVSRDTQNSTCKRNDLNYEKLAKISMTRFREYDRINIMPMNVSDGTEAYFISKPFIEELGPEEFERKCSPIVSTDVCSDIIETYPKRNIVQLFKGEAEELSIYRKPMFNEVSVAESHRLMGYDPENKLYELKPEYRKFFRFGVQDFQERIANLHDEGNSIISIRNCLRQSFGDFKSAIIVQNLANKLKGASLFITGNYDRGMLLFESALDDYFVEIDHNIWGLRDYKPVKHEKISINSKIENIIQHTQSQNKTIKYIEKLAKLIK